MKRNLFLLSALVLVITSAMFWSCQKEEMMNTEDVMLKKGKVDRGYSFTSNASDICAGGDLVLTLNGSGNKQIQMLVDGEWVQLAHVSQGDEPLEATIEDIAAGTYYFRHTSDKGFTIVGPINISSCPGSSCEELDVDLVCGETSNTLTVTFTAGATGSYVIQGGLNAKVIEITSRDASSGDFNDDHQSVTNSNAYVTRWEGHIDACDEVVITMEFIGKCEIGNWTAELQ